MRGPSTGCTFPTPPVLSATVNTPLVRAASRAVLFPRLHPPLARDSIPSPGPQRPSGLLPEAPEICLRGNAHLPRFLWSFAHSCCRFRQHPGRPFPACQSQEGRPPVCGLHHGVDGSRGVSETRVDRSGETREFLSAVWIWTA